VYLQFYPNTTFFLLRSGAYINSLGKFGFRDSIGLQKQMSGSSRVRACNFGLRPGSGFKLRPFYNSEHVCRGQQGKIERIHPPPTNSKYRVKSFCEVGYTSFSPNVIAAGKRISMEFLVRWG